MAGVGLARAVWIPSAAALIGSIGFFAIQPYQIERPGRLKQYVSSDKSLSLQRPENWKARSFSSQAVQDSIRFTPSENVRFEIESDLTGSLMADIGRAADSSVESAAGAVGEMAEPSSGIAEPSSGIAEPSSGIAQQSPELAQQLGEMAASRGQKKSPVEKVHALRAAMLEEDLEGFKQTSTAKTTLGGLEAVESEFTFKGEGAWGSRTISGTHVTALTPDKAIYLTYYGPADQMSTLKPVFTSMRSSIRFGSLSPGGQ
jgi:hypothetical protein